MLTRRTVAGAVAVGAVAAAVLGVTAASAATTKAVVTAGSAAVGSTVAVTGTSTASLTFTNTRNGAKLVCTSVVAKGTTSPKTVNGAGPYNGLASITSSTWTGCKLQNLYNVTVTQSGNWSINANGGTATTSGGLTNGSISNIAASVAGSGCTFTVGGAATGGKGTVYGTYTNGTSSSTLAINTTPVPDLKILTTSASSCFGGAVAAGDVATFSGAFTITADVSANNPVKVVVS